MIIRSCTVRESKSGGEAFGDLDMRASQHQRRRTLAICMRDIVPSCIRAPPERHWTTTGNLCSLPYSKARVTFSPSAQPSEPPAQAKGKTATEATRAWEEGYIYFVLALGCLSRDRGFMYTVVTHDAAYRILSRKSCDSLYFSVTFPSLYLLPLRFSTRMCTREAYLESRSCG